MNQNFDSTDGQGFSMDIATLMRIDNALKLLSAFQKIRHRKAVLRHLRELHKEVYPFLKDEDRLVAAAYWAQIITQTTTTNNPWETLDQFDFWLRDQLYLKGLLMHRQQDPGTAIMRGMR